MLYEAGSLCEEFVLSETLLLRVALPTLKYNVREHEDVWAMQ